MVAACSGTSGVIDDQRSSDQNDQSTESNEFQDDDNESSEGNEEAYPYLSKLSDTYSSRSNNIPEEFARIKEELNDEDEEKDLFQGFRVQIFSGPDVALADTAAKHFRIWSAQNIDGYQAATYTFFKAPYYRVHVGDFHDRDKAIQFTNLIKRRFRDSWVVFDRVDPWKVPADSVTITRKR